MDSSIVKYSGGATKGCLWVDILGVLFQWRPVVQVFS